MRFSHLVATLLVLTSVAIPQSVAHVPASKGKPETGWSSLRPDARRAILAALEEDNPSWTQEAELTAPDGEAGDGFGNFVAVSGSTVVVGAPAHPVGLNVWQGTVYVFVQSGDTWSQQAELSASDGLAYDGFGISVALSGSTLVVGASNHTVGSNQAQGAAYVFTESGGTWTQQAELTAADGLANDGFGGSVALSGSTVVVGANNRTVGSNIEQGSAYVFAESGGTWSQQAELTASDRAYGDNFGWSVALDGSTAVVAAYRKTVGSNVEQGTVYVFVQSGDTWSQQAELTASDGATYDQFGDSVALSGSTLVVGADDHKVGSNTQQGAAYVFVESGGTWSQQTELTASDGAAFEYFGWSVAASGSTAMVGTPYHTMYTDQGAVYVFVESGGTWSQQAELTASDGAGGDAFGGSVAVSGSTAVVGAPGHTVNSARVGAAYVFVPPSTTVTLSPTSLGFGNQAVNTTGAKTLTLKNAGTATLYNSSIAITAGNSYFAISSNTCGATLAAGKMCKVSVSFTPTQLAAETGTLTFTDNASGSPQTVALSGTGVLPVTLAPAGATYAAQVVGTTSAAKTFTLTNNQTVTLTSVVISTTGDFAISATNCTTSLAAKGKCTISVTFTPTATGKRAGQLSVSDSASNSPQTVAFSGTGVTPATLTPATITFPAQTVGTTSSPKTFTLTNNQTAALDSIAISTTGDFAVSATTCTTSLTAKGKCTISVTFTPTATRKRTGQLSVSDSASNSPQTSNLTGTGE